MSQSDTSNVYRATALFNETRGSRYFQWEPTAKMVKSLYGFWVSAVDATDAAETAYRLYNADDRPNGATERSVSVGDLIALDNGTEVRFLSVDSVGFTDQTDALTKGEDTDLTIVARLFNLVTMTAEEFAAWEHDVAEGRRRLLARRAELRARLAMA